jgi:ABC-type spermidine/putrescine transport system permease subunit II
MDKFWRRGWRGIHSLYTALVYIYLIAPLLIILAMSLNSGELLSRRSTIRSSARPS